MEKKSLVIKEHFEKRLESVNKVYDELIKPYYDKSIGMINTSYMNKQEKEEFINKRNCLLVQRECYAEIIDFINLLGDVTVECDHDWKCIVPDWTGGPEKYKCTKCGEIEIR